MILWIIFRNVHRWSNKNLSIKSLLFLFRFIIPTVIAAILFAACLHMQSTIHSYRIILHAGKKQLVTVPYWENDPTSLQVPVREICLFYDKPPGTASSTIAAALDQCWVNFSQAKTRLDIPSYILHALNKPNFQAIDEFLMVRSPVVAHHQWHAHLHDHHVSRIKYSCRQLFYLSSTADKRSRLMSYITHSFSTNGQLLNEIVSANTVQAKIALIADQLKNWHDLDGTYPFQGVLTLIPDYVIRSDYFESDLMLLLSKFGCPTNVTSVSDLSPSLSSLNESMSEIIHVVKSVKLRKADPFHNRLLRIAKSKNQLGLVKASRLAKQMNYINRLAERV